MATKTFTQWVQLENFIQSACTKAIMAAAVRITKELRNIIDEQYYHDPDFYPNIYRRTNSFLDSASYRLIGKSMAEIGINTDEMNYKNGFDPEQVVEWAAQSMHGGEMYQTSTTDFWTTFDQWADENVIKILREELLAQGLKLSK
jgi:hypothetical protein